MNDKELEDFFERPLKEQLIQLNAYQEESDRICDKVIEAARQKKKRIQFKISNLRIKLKAMEKLK